MASRKAAKPAPLELVQQAPLGRFLLLEVGELGLADHRELWARVRDLPGFHSCRDLALCDVQTLAELVLLRRQ